MEIETLNIMNDGMYFSLMIKVIMLIVVLLTVAGLVIYVAGTCWFCFKETRLSKTAAQTRDDAVWRRIPGARYACLTRKHA